MPKSIRESRPVAVTEADSGKSGRLQVGLITPGWGSSGYYSAKVLENAAAAKVFPAGTQMFLDHPGEHEAYDRPERSVRDLAAVLTEDATWDGERLSSEVQVFGPFVEMLTDENFAQAIGVSIRALAEVTTGEAEGRKGRIVSELVEAESVDFVTKAGRGGSILAVLESARPAAVVERAVAHGVSEATANDTREALAQALREEFGGEKSWVWVRDFDDATVWFEWETPDEAGTYAMSYQMGDDGAVTIDPASRVEVRARTEYVPVKAAESGPRDVPAPAGQPNTHTPKSEEDNMGQIQVDEAQHASLTEAAGRVPTLEAERDAANQRADVAERNLRDRDNRDAAGVVIDAQAREASVTFTALERRGLLASLPVTESGELDEAAYTETVKTAAAEKAQEAGAGSIRGFGSTISENSSDVVKEAEKAAAGAFGRQVKEA
jgi:hypothetical protein